MRRIRRPVLQGQLRDDKFSNIPLTKRQRLHLHRHRRGVRGVQSSKAKKHGPEAGLIALPFGGGGTKEGRRGRVARRCRAARSKGFCGVPFIFSAARFISERGFVRAPQRFNPSLRARCRAGIQFSCGLNGPKRVPDRELRRPLLRSFYPERRESYGLCPDYGSCRTGHRDSRGLIAK